MVFQKEGAMNMSTKLTRQREGGWTNADMADKEEGWIREILTLADKGRTGIWDPPLLADIICEQPLK